MCVFVVAVFQLENENENEYSIQKKLVAPEHVRNFAVTASRHQRTSTLLLLLCRKLAGNTKTSRVFALKSGAARRGASLQYRYHPAHT